MIDRKRRSKGGHGIGKAVSVHRDNIGIAFAYNAGTCAYHAILCPIEGKKMLSLVKEHGVFGIQVFWFCITEHAPTKRDSFAQFIMDRKDHAIKKARTEI